MFGHWYTPLMLNPIAPVLEGFANVIVRHVPPPLSWLGYSAVVSVVLCCGALSVFQRVEPYFAESV